MTQTDAGAANKTQQLLADIETFSRQGPLSSDESAKPVIHRETLAFPDLNHAHPGQGSAKPASVQQQAAPAVSPASTFSEQKDSTAANSLLARLKQQAAALQQDAGQRDAQLAMNGQVINAALGAAFHYLNDLIKQLNIIKPAIPKEFIFPGNIAFAGMSWIEGAADFRMVPSATDDRRYDSVTVRYRMSSGKSLMAQRENVKIEPLRKLLHDYGIAFEMEEQLNERNVPEAARFRIPCEIKAGFLVKADYERGDLLLRTRNLDRFGMMEFRLQPDDLNQATLDELTHLMLGVDSRFLKLFRRSA